MTDPRRTVPRTDTLLSDDRLAEPLQRLGRDAVKVAVRTAQEQVRDGLLEVEDLLGAVLGALPASSSGLRSVCNATGVLLHTNLGRAPLSTAAVDAIVAAAGPTDVEFDLDTGGRASRGRSALAALQSAVPSAPAVHVVNNGAAALLLVAAVLADGREIVISRGELVEIGAGFRVPDLLVSAGARLREVGTTNRTSLRDYAAAVGPGTGFVLKVHTSNYVVSGFTSSVEVPELVTLGAPVVADIGSGLLAPHPSLPDEPDAESALAAGAQLVTASADKLLGGPQAGLLLGDAQLVERLRTHPMARALRVDKLTLAALEATLRGPATPTAAALAVPVRLLVDRASSLADDLRAAGVVDVCVVASNAAVGGGSAPGRILPSAAVSLPERYCEPLRRGSHPVVARTEGRRCLLDLRSVPPELDDTLRAAVLAVETSA